MSFSIARSDSVSTQKTSDTKWVGFFFHLTVNPLILWTPTECFVIQCNSDTNNSELAQIPQDQRFSPTRLFHLRCQLQVPGFHLYFWPTGNRFMGFSQPPLMFDNLLWGLTELGKQLLTITYYLVSYKRYNSGSTKWKRRIGQGMREEAQNFHASSGCATLQAPPCVHQCRRSSNPII